LTARTSSQSRRVQSPVSSPKLRASQSWSAIQTSPCPSLHKLYCHGLPQIRVPKLGPCPGSVRSILHYKRVAYLSCLFPTSFQIPLYTNNEIVESYPLPLHLSHAVLRIVESGEDCKASLAVSYCRNESLSLEDKTLDGRDPSSGRVAVYAVA
jgi:hypothetical protein